MLVVADKNIPYVTDAFSDLGDITLVEGRRITPETVADADILLVRSVTRVEEQLIKNARKLKFIASATSGREHIDLSYLKKRGIGFAYAPGSNARSVAQYIVAAIVHLADTATLLTRTLGIIGAGNIGSLVNVYGEALGMKCQLNDPPRERKEGGNNKKYRPLDEVLAESDIVTLHVPLERSGRYPTWHMVDTHFLKRMKTGAILLNTSRGSVVDEAALKNSKNKLGALVIDVWNNEPLFDPVLCGMTDIATPHIAGYSYDGKIKGTEMIYRATCSFFKKKVIWNHRALLRETAGFIDTVKAVDPIAHTIKSVYPVMRDDASMKNILTSNLAKRANKFDALRARYHKRLEFSHYRVRYSNHQGRASEILKKLDFIIEQTGRHA